MGAGYQPCACSNPHQVRQVLTREEFPAAVVVLDRISAAGNGQNPALTALETIRSLAPATQIVLLVEPGTDLATCCRAVSLGVAGFVELGSQDWQDALLERIAQAADRYLRSLQRDHEPARQAVFDETGFAGCSRAMAEVLAQAKRAAAISDVPVLIRGESGTGKQLLAEAIHRLDPKRSAKPFLCVNCAAISGTLADSALFGHKKGAFTGATEDRLGYFRAAHGGTVLLDEISELDLSLQPKLLRVLQESRVLPVGADREERVDVRVIAATNQPLEALVARGKFRLDLYQRLNVISLYLPPLRERREDIPHLFRFFLNKYASYYPRPITSVDPLVYDVLAEAIGQGNVRELENIVRQTLAFKDSGNRIDLSDLPRSVLKARAEPDPHEPDLLTELARAVSDLVRRGRMSLPQMVGRCERLILEQALRQPHRTHSELARALGITRRTLYNKLRKYNLPTRPDADR